MQPTQYVVDEVSATTDGTFELDALARAAGHHRGRSPASSTQQWEDIAPAYFGFDQERRIVRFTYQPSSGLAVRLEGKIDYNEPAFLNSTVSVPYAVAARQGVGRTAGREQRQGQPAACRRPPATGANALPEDVTDERELGFPRADD